MTSVAASDRDVPTRFERLSDRCNPILVREVQQAFAGRGFQATLSLSVGAIVVIMLTLASREQPSGRDVFAIFAKCLVPIALFLVPMQSMNGMRHEASGGIAEQLALTRLAPGRIVLGKLAAALAQYVVFLAVFAPVTAMTFVLRGIDVPTIALVLGLSVLACTTATLGCLAAGSLARYKHLGQAAQGLTAAALVLATFAGMSADLPAVVTIARNSTHVAGTFGTFVGALGAASVLFGMIASAALAHEYENRSTRFRLFAFLGLLGAVLWLLWVSDSPAQLGSSVADLVGEAPWLTLPFWLWAVCEHDRLSPRVRTRVPRRRLQAWIAAPFLPGGQRGLTFVLLLAATALGSLVLVRLAIVTVPRPAAYRAIAIWCYVVAFAVAGRLVRRRLPRGAAYSFTALVAVVLLYALGSILPLVWVLAVEGEVGPDWRWPNLASPSMTLHALGELSEPRILTALAAITAVCVLLGLRDVVRGFREVLDASAERRARDAS